MTTTRRPSRIRTVLISVFVVASMVGYASAYDPNVTVEDIKDAGGTCVADRCYFNGHAWHCVNGRCTPDTSK